MFGFDYTEGGAWSDDGIKAMSKFTDRVQRLLSQCIDYINSDENSKTTIDKAEKELNYVRHFSIKGISEDAEKFQFNTCIARMMEFTNALNKYLSEDTKNKEFLKESINDFVRILAPFAPHFSEEMWSILGNNSSIFNEAWPIFNPNALIKDEVEIAIQVNGKIKARINIPANLDDKAIETEALNDSVIKDATNGKTIVKVIVIKGRLVNIVVK
jgi:leucyl-tRNA synthetase